MLRFEDIDSGVREMVDANLDSPDPLDVLRMSIDAYNEKLEANKKLKYESGTSRHQFSNEEEIDSVYREVLGRVDSPLNFGHEALQLIRRSTAKKINVLFIPTVIKTVFDSTDLLESEVRPLRFGTLGFVNGFVGIPYYQLTTSTPYIGRKVWKESYPSRTVIGEDQFVQYSAPEDLEQAKLLRIDGVGWTRRNQDNIVTSKVMIDAKYGYSDGYREFYERTPYGRMYNVDRTWVRREPVRIRDTEPTFEHSEISTFNPKGGTISNYLIWQLKDEGPKSTKRRKA